MKTTGNRIPLEEWGPRARDDEWDRSLLPSVSKRSLESTWVRVPV